MITVTATTAWAPWKPLSEHLDAVVEGELPAPGELVPLTHAVPACGKQMAEAHTYVVVGDPAEPNGFRWRGPPTRTWNDVEFVFRFLPDGALWASMRPTCRAVLNDPQPTERLVAMGGPAPEPGGLDTAEERMERWMVEVESWAMAQEGPHKVYGDLGFY